MKISYSLSQLLIQSVLTELFIIAYLAYDLGDVVHATTASVSLIFFIGVFSIMLTLIFRHLPYWLRIIIVAIGSSLIVSLIITLYPEIAFGIEWWVLFLLLLGASLFSHFLLYMATDPAQTTTGSETM